MAPEHANDREWSRVSTVLAYGLLDSPPEPCFDRLVAMAADVCEMPVALVTVLDDERQWFKATVGTDVREMPRQISFCTHALDEPDGLMLVPDATLDSRFCDNPLVTGGPRIRAYAGVPLVVATGEPIGTLCVLDVVPRSLTARQLASLRALARVVVRYIERRRRLLFN